MKHRPGGTCRSGAKRNVWTLGIHASFSQTDAVQALATGEAISGCARIFCSTILTLHTGIALSFNSPVN
jgi:hypothetical protein